MKNSAAVEAPIRIFDRGGLLARLWHHLEPRRQRQFVVLSGLVLVSALAEAVTLSAVLPFIGVLARPAWVFEHPTFANILRFTGITSGEQLVLPLTIAFVLTAVIAAAIRTLVLWVSTRLASNMGADVSLEVYRRTLYQPYQVHVARNSSEVISGITNKVHGLVFGVLVPLLTLLSSTALLIAIIGALIAINPMINTMVIIGFGAIYGGITLASRQRLRRNSRRIAGEQTQVVKSLQEGLGGIRDVLLEGAQPVYCEVYRRADGTLRRAEGNNHFIGQSPRFAMESLGMVLIAGLAFVLTRQDGGLAAALPMLGALALGAQRLLPALQQSHAAWASIVAHESALSDIVQLLDQPVSAELLQPKPAPLPFEQAIRFETLRFRYAPDAAWVLDGIDLSIKKGTRIGFVGSTGSGKSTLMDVLMGLLMPTEGRLLIDGQPLSGAGVRAWQQTVAHVPQSIFLADATLAENIAFGVPRDAIDLERVKLAARQAQIAEFIDNQPAGYETVTGERGVRLSGGQRQRIGIARALYKRANVLVLDEATSALDNSTEQSVMDAINALSRDLTILVIAHRLTTVQRCDIIVELRHGRVAAQGTYEQLLESSSSFRQMAHGFTTSDGYRARHV